MKEVEVIALLGNPNVGKSTIFNGLTGMRQHTGNWTGKTVEVAQGEINCGGKRYKIIDLPGAYSLNSQSPEQELTRDFVLGAQADKIVVVCDGSALERTLTLLLEVKECCSNLILCVNLLDEAAKKGKEINLEALSQELGVTVVGTNARQEKGLGELVECIEKSPPCVYNSDVNTISFGEDGVKKRIVEAQRIGKAVTKRKGRRKSKGDAVLDRVLMGKMLAVPAMLFFLSLLIFITVFLANYPSQLLSRFFTLVEDATHRGLSYLGAHSLVCGFVCQGIIRTVGWVISVMLPPMAIFFPLFALLEDWGYLPRIAFNLDRPFCKCGTSGKQSLTMCMGLGCNAVGITGCRIIDSPKERKIGILTNSFIPCNGKFPTLIMISTLFFAGSVGFGAVTSLIITLSVVTGVSLTLLVSWLLSKAMGGEKSVFVLELPSFRAPRVGKALVRSLFDRTAKVLLRAVLVSVPAGAMIWGLSYITVGGGSVLQYLATSLNPFASVFGLDGVIILAFILGLPANEIIVPIALMIYSSAGAITNAGTDVIGEILMSNGWNVKTAMCAFSLMMFHSPCLTSLWTVKKETGSLRLVCLSAVIPTVIGLAICFLINIIGMLFGV